MIHWGFPSGTSGKKKKKKKNPPASARDVSDLDSIPESGSSCGGGHGENPMDRGVWQATVHGVKNSQT